MSPRRRRHAPRGSALILAVLIMFAMLALGMMAMRSTTQAIAGTGNLRLARQARYVAETGLYNVATVLQQGGMSAYLAERARLRNGTEPLRVRFRSDGQVAYFRNDEIAPIQGAFVTTAPTADFLTLDPNRPNPLGQFGEGAGLVALFEVEADGFTSFTALVTSPEAGFGDCQVELVATGFLVRPEAGKTTEEVFDSDAGRGQFAQQKIKAVLKFSHIEQGLCR